MIISHKHKFIFIKTEKTAGTSIEIALSRICGPNDIITPVAPKDEKYRQKLNYTGSQNYLIPFSKYSLSDFIHMVKKRKRLRFFNHISAKEVKRLIEPEIWNSYYKFTFERNPFDKLISWYYWSGGDKKYGSISNFIKSGDAKKVKGYQLYTDQGKVIVDQVYFFEDIANGLQDVSEKLNLDDPISLPKKKLKGNTRKNKLPYQEILNDSEISWVKTNYKKELEMFDYSF